MSVSPAGILFRAPAISGGARGDATIIVGALYAAALDHRRGDRRLPDAAAYTRSAKAPAPASVAAASARTALSEVRTFDRLQTTLRDACRRPGLATEGHSSSHIRKAARSANRRRIRWHRGCSARRHLCCACCPVLALASSALLVAPSAASADSCSAGPRDGRARQVSSMQTGMIAGSDQVEHRGRRPRPAARHLPSQGRVRPDDVSAAEPMRSRRARRRARAQQQDRDHGRARPRRRRPRATTRRWRRRSMPPPTCRRCRPPPARVTSC